MVRKRGEGVVKINNLFQKYTALLNTSPKIIIKTFVSIVNEVCGFEIEEKSCEYNTYTNTIHIKNQGIKKTEILIRKREIINELKKQTNPKNQPKEII